MNRDKMKLLSAEKGRKKFKKEDKNYVFNNNCK